MRNFLFIPSFLIVNTGFGQQPETSAWIGLQAPVKLSNHWQWHNDAGYRTIKFSAAAYQYLYRTGIRYLFNKQWSVAMGTAIFTTRNTIQKSDHEFGMEFRLWQEMSMNKQFGRKFSFQNRIRTEERWFEALPNKPAYAAFRFRYRLAGEQSISDKWSLQLANEYMQQAVKNKFSFNQYRLLVTAMYSLTATLQVQSGYMWLVRQASSSHNLVLSFQKFFSIHGSK